MQTRPRRRKKMDLSEVSALLASRRSPTRTTASARLRNTTRPPNGSVTIKNFYTSPKRPRQSMTRRPRKGNTIMKRKTKRRTSNPKRRPKTKRDLRGRNPRKKRRRSGNGGRRRDPPTAPSGASCSTRVPCLLLSTNPCPTKSSFTTTGSR